MLKYPASVKPHSAAVFCMEGPVHSESIDVAAQCTVAFLAEQCAQVLGTDEKMGGNGFQS